jgi:Endosomal/lysosomal potassium channel TMEM175
MTEREADIGSTLPANLDELPRLNGFRLRGIEMTRLETFIDAAFAFAITMLVIANGQVPQDIDALLGAFKNVPVFVASIAVLAVFWRGHWLWSRRYGLEDTTSIVISWGMLVTILIYVYPLKVLFGEMFYYLSGHRVGQEIVVHSVMQARALFALYALGFAAISLEIVFLNLHAWRLREPLRLNDREKLITRGELSGWSIPVSIGLLSLLLALTLPFRWLEWSGWAFSLMFILLPIHNKWLKRRNRKAEMLNS